MTYLAQSRLRTRSSFKFTSSACRVERRSTCSRFALPPTADRVLSLPSRFGMHRRSFSSPPPRDIFTRTGRIVVSQVPRERAVRHRDSSGALVIRAFLYLSRDRDRSNHLARYPGLVDWSTAFLLFRHPDLQRACFLAFSLRSPGHKKHGATRAG